MGWWTSTAGRLRAFRSLTGRERYLLLEAALLLSFVAACLRVLGLGTLQRMLGGCPRPTPNTGAGTTGPTALGVARAVATAARHAPFHASCLHRSLVLLHLLHRRGVPAEMYIGVRKHESALKAHAWIEVDGRVLTDALEVRERFTPFERALAPPTVHRR
jgi:hypothetical protein